MGEDVTLFTEVDRTGDPDFFIRFLDQVNANPDIQTSKPIILDRLHLRPGFHVLDPGLRHGGGCRGHRPARRAFWRRHRHRHERDDDRRGAAAHRGLGSSCCLRDGRRDPTQVRREHVRCVPDGTNADAHSGALPRARGDGAHHQEAWRLRRRVRFSIGTHSGQSQRTMRHAFCLFEWEDPSPVILHINNRPTLRMGLIECFVELPYNRAIIGPFARFVVVADN
jgi:hypothetical protein